MILAQHDPGAPIYGPALPAASAMAPHRGDVTTVRAAAFVRLQAAKRTEQLRVAVMLRGESDTVPLPSTGWTERRSPGPRVM